MLSSLLLAAKLIFSYLKSFETVVTKSSYLRLKKLVQILVFIFCKASVMFHAEICHFSAQICLRKDSNIMPEPI